ncbi:MAG: TetR/AcrR family transcriptional regulator, partial [Bacteroidota bacterium]|nr:TetR/AcrR family transcriptional regulator [Bacteroidota bacterium]
KDLIIEKSLALFNEKGIENVSAKIIAADLGISDGNLRYHYRTKEDIIYALYQNLLEEIMEDLKPLEQEDIDLKGIIHSFTLALSTLHRYRFLMIDIVGIMRKFPTIKENYQSLYEPRKHKFKALLSNCIEKGILREENFPNQYDYFILQFYTLTDFWISESEILYQDNNGYGVSFHINMILSFIVPYLTEQGLEEFKSFTKGMK